MPKLEDVRAELVRHLALGGSRPSIEVAALDLLVAGSDLLRLVGLSGLVAVRCHGQAAASPDPAPRS